MPETVHESRAIAAKNDNIVVRRLWVAWSGGIGGDERPETQRREDGSGLLDLNQQINITSVCHNIGQRYIKLRLSVEDARCCHVRKIESGDKCKRHYPDVGDLSLVGALGDHFASLITSSS